MVAKQGFFSLFSHQGEELRDDKKKKTTTTIVKETTMEPVNAATNGQWKSIRIDGSKSISLTCTSHSRSFTPPINTVRPNRRKNKQTD